MRPEERLLIDVARSFVMSRTGRTASGMRVDGIDWERFVGLAERQKLAPIVYALVTNRVLGGVPVEVQLELQEAAMGGALAHAILEREVLGLLTRLREAGIVALVYKGLALGALAYGDASLRPHQDLDLMLRKADVLRAGELLREAGYEPEPELARATADQSRHWCELNFDKKIAEGLGGVFHVELHWRVLPGFTAIAGDGDAMVPRRTAMTIAGVELDTPDLVDHLLALALHGAKHRWDELRLVLDVALLAQMLSDDEARQLWERARAWRVTRMVALALRLAERVGGPIMRKPDVDVSPLVRDVEATLFSDAHRSPLQTSLFLLRCLDGLPDLARYFVAHGRSEIDRHAGLGNAVSYAVGRAVTLLRA